MSLSRKSCSQFPDPHQQNNTLPRGMELNQEKKKNKSAPEPCRQLGINNPAPAAVMARRRGGAGGFTLCRAVTSVALSVGCLCKVPGGLGLGFWDIARPMRTSVMSCAGWGAQVEFGAELSELVARLKECLPVFW